MFTTIKYLSDNRPAYAPWLTVGLANREMDIQEGLDLARSDGFYLWAGQFDYLPDVPHIDASGSLPPFRVNQLLQEHYA